MFINRIIAFLCGLLLSFSISSQGISVNDSGTWREAEEVHVNDSGTWRAIQEIYVNDGGTWRQVFSASIHETTITVGNDGVPLQYGYIQSLYGSIGDATFNDHGSNARTILIAIWQYPGDGQFMRFVLSGASIPDTDTTFVSITIGGVTFTRASRTGYNASFGGGDTSWEWNNVNTSAISNAGGVSLVIE